LNWQPQHEELMRTWESYNRQLFKGELSTPVILIDELEDDILEIENLGIAGTYQLTKTGESKIEISADLFQPSIGEGSPRFDKFKLWIAQDVLLHEMVHQFLGETRELDINEKQHMWHGHKFMEVCNRIGAELELQPVYMHQRPYCFAWPHSARPRKQIEKAMEGLSKDERYLAVRLIWRIAMNGPDGVGPPTGGGRVVRQESVLAA